MANKRKNKQKLMTNLDISNIVDSEGLDYAITSYMGSEDFEDPEMAILWNKARMALERIEEKLEEARESNED